MTDFDIVQVLNNLDFPMLALQELSMPQSPIKKNDNCKCFPGDIIGLLESIAHVYHYLFLGNIIASMRADLIVERLDFLVV